MTEYGGSCFSAYNYIPEVIPFGFPVQEGNAIEWKSFH